MKLVIQRVQRASVDVDDRRVASIERGFLVLCGVGQGDTDADAAWLARKTASLRCFEDDGGRMNRGLEEVGGAVLVVSQFTLYGDCHKGNRPSFISAAKPDEGLRLYTLYVEELRRAGLHVETGQFAAHMRVDLLNDGPVTLLLESAGRATASSS